MEPEIYVETIYDLESERKDIDILHEEEVQANIYRRLSPQEWSTILQVDKDREKNCDDPYTIPLTLPTSLSQFPVLAEGNYFMDLGDCDIDKWIIVGYKYELDESGRYTNKPKTTMVPFSAIVTFDTDRRGGYYDSLTLSDNTKVLINSKRNPNYWNIDNLPHKELDKIMEERSYDEGEWEYWGKQEFTIQVGDDKWIDIPVNFWSMQLCYDQPLIEYCELSKEEEELGEEEVKEGLIPYIEVFVAIENEEDLIQFAEL